MKTDEIVQPVIPREINRTHNVEINGERHSKMNTHWGAEDDCPIKTDLNTVMAIGEQFVTILQRLQQDLEGCELCNDWEACRITQALNLVIDELILEINEEWDIDL
jgi:hypothetical protein